jgi:hypothetical protein
MYPPVHQLGLDPPLNDRARTRYQKALPALYRAALVAAALAVFGVVAAAYAAAASSSLDRVAKPTRTTGVKTIGGAPARVFCGPAKATVRAGASTYRFANGACLDSPGFTVNIGILSFGSGSIGSASRVKYFGVWLPRAKAGTYTPARR